MRSVLTKRLLLTASFFLSSQAINPAWSVTPKKQMFNSAPLSETELLNVKNIITKSYSKKGEEVNKVYLQKDSDYSLSGYVLAKSKNLADQNQPAPLIEYSCTASKSLDGSISWSCSPKSRSSTQLPR